MDHEYQSSAAIYANLGGGAGGLGGLGQGGETGQPINYVRTYLFPTFFFSLHRYR